MFIFRSLPTYEDEVNVFLGKSYSVCYKTHENFQEMVTLNRLTPATEFLEAIIIDEQDKPHPVYSNRIGNYIMTESGKTFFKFKN